MNNTCIHEIISRNACQDNGTSLQNSVSLLEFFYCLKVYTKDKGFAEGFATREVIRVRISSLKKQEIEILELTQWGSVNS